MTFTVVCYSVNTFYTLCESETHFPFNSFEWTKAFNLFNSFEIPMFCNRYLNYFPDYFTHLRNSTETQVEGHISAPYV